MTNPEPLSVGSESTASILKDLRLIGVTPNPFEDPTTRNLAETAFEKLSSVPFAPYWTKCFQDLRDHGGSGGGIFPKEVFELARFSESNVSLATAVAQALGRRFGADVLAGEFDTLTPEISISRSDQLPDFANLLIKIRNELECPEGLEGSYHKHPQSPREISYSWIQLALQ